MKHIGVLSPTNSSPNIAVASLSVSVSSLLSNRGDVQQESGGGGLLFPLVSGLFLFSFFVSFSLCPYSCMSIIHVYRE